MHNSLRILVLAFFLYILLEPALGQDSNDVTQENENEEKTQQVTDETPAVELSNEVPMMEPDSDPDSLSRSQPDSMDARALLRKRLLYGIGGAIPVWLILSGDDDKDGPGIEVGPPPGWPNN